MNVDDGSSAVAAATKSPAQCRVVKSGSCLWAQTVEDKKVMGISRSMSVRSGLRSSSVRGSCSERGRFTIHDTMIRYDIPLIFRLLCVPMYIITLLSIDLHSCLPSLLSLSLFFSAFPVPSPSCLRLRRSDGPTLDCSRMHRRPDWEKARGRR